MVDWKYRARCIRIGLLFLFKKHPDIFYDELAVALRNHLQLPNQLQATHVEARSSTNISAVDVGMEFAKHNLGHGNSMDCGLMNCDCPHHSVI